MWQQGADRVFRIGEEVLNQVLNAKELARGVEYMTQPSRDPRVYRAFIRAALSLPDLPRSESAIVLLISRSRRFGSLLAGSSQTCFTLWS